VAFANSLVVMIFIKYLIVENFDLKNKIYISK